VAAVEFALVAPLFVMMIMGLWEYGRMVQVMQVLINGAREGGRQAATSSATLTDIKANVKTYIQNAEPSITDTTGYDLTYTNITTPTSTDPSTANQLDRFTITVTLPFNNVRWLALSYFVPSGTTLTASVDWYSMRDIPVQVNTSIPVE
jgi:Flp pilus assembly protein TadG